MAPPALVAGAQRALAAGCTAAGVPVSEVMYARVDGIERDRRLVVMELECIEPQLHLRSHPGAAERLAEAVSRALV
jgi:hypothetical protein